MKKILLTLLSFICISLIYLALHLSFFKKEEIYIAVAGPMSGPEKAAGEEQVKGIDLYISKMNEEGGLNGRKIVPIIYDDYAAVAERASEIANEKKALLVLGHSSSSACITGGKIYKRNEIPAITASAGAEKVTFDNEWYFRLVPNDRFQAAFIANYINKDLGKLSASIVFRKDDYSMLFAEYFEKSANKLGTEIIRRCIFDPKGNPDNECERIADKLRTTGDPDTEPGIIFLAVNPAEGAKIIKSLYSFKLTSQSLDKIKKQSVPESIIAGLRHLSDREYKNKIRFSDALETVIGKDQAVKYRPLILKNARYPEKNYSVIGQHTFSEKSLIRELRKYPEEKDEPGYYSNGIYAVSPFIPAIASEKAYAFRQEFIKKYNEEPSWISACYYDAAYIALEALKKADIRGKRYVRSDRRKIRSALAGFYGNKNSAKGITGNIYFNKNGDIEKPYGIGFYESQDFIPAYSQYQQLEDISGINNIFKEALDGNILVIDRKIMNKTRIVYAGIYINKIDKLDTQGSFFSLDFYLWFRFQGKFDDAKIEFINIVNPVRERIGSGISEHLVTEEINNGIILRLYHIKSDFKAEFDFHAYPFDPHIIPVKFHHADQTRDKLIYVPCDQGIPQSVIRSVPDLRQVNDKKKIAVNMTPESDGTEWEVKEPLLYQDIMSNISTLGNPKFFNSEYRVDYSRFNAEIPIKRKHFSFIVIKFLPIILIMLILYSAYFFPFRLIEIRVVIFISVLIANAFFHITVLSDCLTGYLIAIEYAFFTVYVLAGVTILISVWGYKMYKNNRVADESSVSAGTEEPLSDSEKEHMETDRNLVILARAGQIIYPGIAIAGFLLMFAVYLQISG